MNEHVRYAGPLRWDVCAACHDPWPCAQVDRLIVELTPPCPSSRPFGPCTKQCEELAGHDGPHRSQCITWTDEEVAVTGHIKVIPGAAPVRIGEGPTISTSVTGFCSWNPDPDNPGEGAVIINGTETYYMPRPFPDPVPIPGTPYEAYTFGSWYIGEFAIRIRKDQP